MCFIIEHMDDNSLVPKLDGLKKHCGKRICKVVWHGRQIKKFLINLDS